MTVAFAATAIRHARADGVLRAGERSRGAARRYRLAVNRTLIACAFVSCLAAACSQASEESKPVEAVSERPVAEVKPAEAVNERSDAVAAWSARLIQRSHGPEDSDAILLDVSIEDAGGRRPLATNIIGPLVVFESERKILSCESTGPMAGARPIMIDLHGQRVDGPEHPGYLRTCERIEGSNLAFLHYSMAREGQQYSLIRIVDTNGRVVLEKELSRAGEVEVRAGGKIYRVQVPDPELPG